MLAQRDAALAAIINAVDESTMLSAAWDCMTSGQQQRFKAKVEAILKQLQLEEVR